ncbi:MAG: hypothetical protein ACXW3G_13820 [Rhodoplanes sp.]|nr:hypothetical protein [Rhodoplanes sp.]
MPEQTQLQDVNNSAEAAAYIADLLAQIARRHGLDALGFILDMAHLEAEALSHIQETSDSNLHNS